MATLIASTALSGTPVRELHAGVNSVTAVYSLTATSAAGDIIQFCKLPDRAKVLGVQLMTNVNPGDAYNLNIGTRADHDLFIASASLSANVLFQTNVLTGFNVTLDISDAATTRYTMIEGKVANATGTGTKSGAISVTVLYSVDDAVD